MTLNLIALGICIIWALAIGLIDLISFRIHNSSLVFGLVTIWPALFLMGQRLELSLAVLAFSLLVLTAGLTSLVGMGDVKLVLFVAPWLHYANMRNPLFLLIVLSWLQLTVGLLIKGTFPRRIAFAPAILAAVVLNMAT